MPNIYPAVKLCTIVVTKLVIIGVSTAVTAAINVARPTSSANSSISLSVSVVVVVVVVVVAVLVSVGVGG